MKVSLVSCVVLYLCLPVLRPVVVQLSIFVVILRILAASYVSLVLYAMLYLCCCNNVHALHLGSAEISTVLSCALVRNSCW